MLDEVAPPERHESSGPPGPCGPGAPEPGAAPPLVRLGRRIAGVTAAVLLAAGMSTQAVGAATAQVPPTTPTSTTTAAPPTTAPPTTAPPTTAPPTTAPSTTAPPTTTPPATSPPTTAPPPPPPPPPPVDPAAKLLDHLDVSLGTQHVNAIARDGSLLWSFPMSSGSNGRTPTGTFAVYSRSQWTTASGDPSVSMQWMTRFRGGIGFHAIPRRNGVPLYTPLGIRPVSHGCIRLGDDQARWIYATVPTGTRVVVK